MTSFWAAAKVAQTSYVSWLKKHTFKHYIQLNYKINIYFKLEEYTFLIQFA